MSNIMRPFSFIPVFDDLDKEFNRLRQSGFDRSIIETSDWQPTVDVVEEDKQFVVKVDIPGVEPKDIDVAQLYDPYSLGGIIQLEELGFCERGEGGKFVEGGDNIRIDGKIPCNTSGGLLSEAYIHGVNLIIEGVRQCRGTSTNQKKDANLCLVTAGPGVPSSAMILRN